MFTAYRREPLHREPSPSPRRAAKLRPYGSPQRLGIYDLLNHDDPPAPTWHPKYIVRPTPSSDDEPPLTDALSEYSSSRSFEIEVDGEDAFEVDVASSDDELSAGFGYGFGRRAVGFAVSDERGRWNEPVPKRAREEPPARLRLRSPPRYPSSDSSCPPMTAASERSDFSFEDDRLPPSSPFSVSMSILDDEPESERVEGSDTKEVLDCPENLDGDGPSTSHELSPPSSPSSRPSDLPYADDSDMPPSDIPSECDPTPFEDTLDPVCVPVLEPAAMVISASISTTCPDALDTPAPLLDDSIPTEYEPRTVLDESIPTQCPSQSPDSEPVPSAVADEPVLLAPLSPLSSMVSSRRPTPEPELPSVPQSALEPMPLAQSALEPTPVASSSTLPPHAPLDGPSEEAIPAAKNSKGKARVKSSDDLPTAPPRKKRRPSPLEEEEPTEKRARKKADVPRRKADASGRVRPRPKPRRKAERSSPIPSSSRSSLSPLPDSDAEDGAPPPRSPVKSRPAMSSENAEYRGMLIEAFATSRASALSPSVLYKSVMASRPALAGQKSKQEWVVFFGGVLEEGARECGVFGRIDSSSEDDAAEARWFYCPENDEDQDRAALVRSMNPRAEKRSETKKYKQYYWRPLDKISKWDPEDSL